MEKDKPEPKKEIETLDILWLIWWGSCRFFTRLLETEPPKNIGTVARPRPHHSLESPPFFSSISVSPINVWNQFQTVQYIL
jgi:hypothetical protein